MWTHVSCLCGSQNLNESVFKVSEAPLDGFWLCCKRLDTEPREDAVNVKPVRTATRWFPLGPNFSTSIFNWNPPTISIRYERNQALERPTGLDPRQTFHYLHVYTHKQSHIRRSYVQIYSRIFNRIKSPYHVFGDWFGRWQISAAHQVFLLSKTKKVCGHFMETCNKCLTSVATDFISPK